MRTDNTWQVYTYNCGKTVCDKGNLEVYDNSENLVVYANQRYWQQYEDPNVLYNIYIKNTMFEDCTKDMNEEILKDRKKCQSNGIV